MSLSAIDAHPARVEDSLLGKVVLITGAGGSIGRATALLLAKAGARVALTDIDARGLGVTTKLVDEAGGSALTLSLDVRREPQWIECIEALKSHWHRLDVLVNNAGVCAPRRLLQLDYESWRWHLDVELDGKFFGCKHAVPLMAASGGGSIINIGSLAGRIPVAGLAAYVTAKAGVCALSRTLAAECAADGLNIRVNTILPGGVQSAIWVKMAYGGKLPEGGAPDYDQIIEKHTRTASRSNPLRHPAYPEDVANAVLFLASDRSSYINATELVIDGGSSGMRVLPELADNS